MNDQIDVYENTTYESELYDKIENENLNDIISKTNKQYINKGWNDKNETLIISIGMNAQCYQYMHERSYQICNNIYILMKVIIIITSSFVSISTSIPNDILIKDYIYIAVYVCTYITTFLSVLIHFLHYEKRAIQHLDTSNKFGKIYHNIQQQMCLYRKDRELAFKYLSNMLKQYDMLIAISPVIISIVYNNFKRDFDLSESNIPEISHKFQKIQIITENPEIGLHKRNGVHIENNIDILNKKTSMENISMNNFCINGDIQDNEINACNEDEIKKLRKRFLQENSAYEYLRFIQNE